MLHILNTQYDYIKPIEKISFHCTQMDKERTDIRITIVRTIEDGLRNRKALAAKMSTMYRPRW